MPPCNFGYPKKIEFNSNIIDVRGEVIMPKKNFENLNSSTNEKNFQILAMLLQEL